MTPSTSILRSVGSRVIRTVMIGFCGCVSAMMSGTVEGGEEIDFNRDIRPLLSGNCFACHGPDEEAREGDLRLDLLAGATADRGGTAAIVPGSAEQSIVIERITTENEDLRMPPAGKGKRFSAEEVALLRRWIDAGAPYSRHWSYVPPQQAPLPTVQRADWPANAIDYFVLAALQERGLEPAPPADRETLARRVAIALTGLPPTWDEVQAFVADPRDDAYESYVDAQLSKPTFGERWGRVWLDLARYADSAGYADDPARTIWAYRDYVVSALNNNIPFDQFTIEQLAGDLLPQPTDWQLIATAFHRNTMTNSEGGTNDEQFRNEAIVDRVNTTMAVWMGTTIACAQCHTHKYDPLSQQEYFRLFDFFNQSQDADRRDESPLLEVLTDEQKRRQGEVQTLLADLQRQLDTQTPQLDEGLDRYLAAMRKPPQWETLAIGQASTDQGNLEIAEGSRVRLVSERPAKATYTLHIPVSEPRALTALRLHIPPAQQSNFVLSRVSAAWKPDQPQAPQGRFVRIQLPGPQRILHLAEVQVLHAGVNIALQGATATQSSTDFGGPASRAIDGNTSGDYQAGSVTHTAQENDPWLEIDLASDRAVDQILLWNRTDNGEPIRDRARGYRVELLSSDRQKVWETTSQSAPSPSVSHDLTGTREIPLVAALANYNQPDFPAEKVLPPAGPQRDMPPDPATGWAIGGGTGTSRTLTLVLGQRESFAAGEIILHLAQVSKFDQHVITELQIEAADDPQVPQWAAMPDAIRTLVTAATEINPAQRQDLSAYYRTIAPELAEVRGQREVLQREQSALQPTTTVPIMRELPDSQRRTTKVQLRGNYQSVGDEVQAGVPEVFHQLPEDAPRNRLGLARWLVDRANPLTARVVVNRHWEQIFGVGIVETSEEFGSQGDLPSHPALLDYLAVDLMDHGWDLKRLLKQLVMSSTFRQSSAVSPQLQEIDPDNRLYARGPRFRIAAEVVRDQTLAAAGLLSGKAFGPPVRPPQPQLGLSAAFGSATDWSPSDGEDRYRRAIYTTWRRSNPYPSMATFDAPNREVCTLRRSRTNTPLQALVTLNDPVYIEAAQALARRMVQKDDSSTAEVDPLTRGFQLALLRNPIDVEWERLQEMYDQVMAYYQQHPEAAKDMATNPRGPLPEGADPVVYAALTVVANTIFNLDEFLMPK